MCYKLGVLYSQNITCTKMCPLQYCHTAFGAKQDLFVQTLLNTEFSSEEIQEFSFLHHRNLSNKILVGKILVLCS